MITMATPVPRSSKASVPDQGQLALSSVKAHKLFPNRTTLYVREVANVFETSDNQVISWIEEGLLHAVNIAGAIATGQNPKGNKSLRNYWRVPVSAFDAFVELRRNNPEVGR